jgi:hypothetical protein
MEFRAYRENDFFYANNQTGQFIFDNTYTRQASNSPNTIPQIGFSFASFLLGIPTNASQIVVPASYAEQSTTWGFFAHDDWKFNNRLTLNLGLRYEVEGALTERFNRSVRGFNASFVQPIETAARTAYANNPTPEVPASAFNVRGGVTFAGVDGEPRGLYVPPKTNFMPRIGFAFKINDKTVLRGGYGIFFGFLGQRRGDVVQSGFSQGTPLSVTLNNGLTFVETLSNPFSTGVLQPVGAALGPRSFLGQGFTFFNSKPKSPYMQRWEVNIQRELPGGFVVEAAYVGNRGTHIEFTRNINALPIQYLSTSSVVAELNTRNTYLGQLIPNPFVGLMPSTAGAAFRSSTIARSQLLRPYPQFGDINTTDKVDPNVKTNFRPVLRWGSLLSF